MSAIRSVDDANFGAQVLKSERPVLVHFSTEWCGPCKAIEPHVEAIAREYAGRLEVVTMDGDTSPETTVALRVRGFPTLVLMKNGHEVARQLGLVPKSKLTALIEPHV